MIYKYPDDVNLIHSQSGILKCLQMLSIIIFTGQFSQSGVHMSTEVVSGHRVMRPTVSIGKVEDNSRHLNHHHQSLAQNIWEVEQRY